MGFSSISFFWDYIPNKIKILRLYKTTRSYMSSTYYKVYISLDLYAHILDLLDKDGYSYTGQEPL